MNDGKLYFSTARNQDRRNYGWNKEPFLDIYSASINSDGSYQEATKMNDKINTKYHEGLVSFSPDGKAMYFGRESFLRKFMLKILSQK